MARAVALARKGRGPTAPNPCVGAVLARDGAVVAEGFHQRCGGPHAEPDCLADARAKGVDPSACTLYVTLEPCTHQGRTPPCTEAILAAGVPRVVIGARDPNTLAGGGAERLAQAGVDVTCGVLQQACEDLIHEFRLWQCTDRAYCILKLAQTLDGRIAARDRSQEPVSCPESFADVQRLRSLVGAVLVGGGTLRADDPSLTCRLDGLADGFVQPLAVAATARLPEPGACGLTRERPEQVLLLCPETLAQSPAAEALRAAGSRVWGLPSLVTEGGAGRGMDFAPALARLRQELGVHHVLCEGGGGLAMSLVSQRLADEVRVYLAPRILGDEAAVASFSGAGPRPMAEADGLRLSRFEPSGRDLKLVYLPTEAPCSQD